MYDFTNHYYNNLKKQHGGELVWHFRFWVNCNIVLLPTNSLFVCLFFPLQRTALLCRMYPLGPLKRQYGAPRIFCNP